MRALRSPVEVPLIAALPERLRRTVATPLVKRVSPAVTQHIIEIRPAEGRILVQRFHPSIARMLPNA